MAIILTKSTFSHPSTAYGAYTWEEKLAMELEMAFKTAKLSNYREFTYSQQGNLTDIDIYEDSTKTVKLFAKDFSYDNKKNLTNILLTRISDGAQLLKIFSYNQKGDLTTIEISAGP